VRLAVTDPRVEPSSLLAPLRKRFDDTVARIEELVNIDSGSFSAEGVNRVADLCQAHFEASGWAVQRYSHDLERIGVGPPLGDMVIGRRTGSRPVAEGGRRLLLLAHIDTVFDESTVATAAIGLPTIDGLAPVGGNAHGRGEWLDLDSLVPRTALLAGLLARLGSGKIPG